MSETFVHRATQGAHRERGAAAVIFAVALPMLLGVVAFVTDLGYARYAKQDLQDAVDLAAISASRELDGSAGATTAAEAAVRAVLNDQGFAAMRLAAGACDEPREAGLVNLCFGRYAARDEAGQYIYPMADRFAPGGSGTASAVQLQARDASPSFFARIFGVDAIDVAVRATGVTTGQYTQVSIGSGLLNLDSSRSWLLNPLLGQLLGSSVDLGVLGFDEGVLGSQIDLVDYLDLLKLGLGVGTYEGVLTTEVSLAGLLDVAASAVTRDGLAGLDVDALRGVIAGKLNVPGVKVELGDVLNLGAGLPDAALDAGLFQTDTFSLVSALIQAAADGEHALTTDVGLLNLGGGSGAAVSVRAGVVEAAQVSRIITQADVDADRDNMVRTAQIRLLTRIDLRGWLGGVLDGLNTVGSLVCPLLCLSILPEAENVALGVNVAPSTLRVTALGCDRPAADRYVTGELTPGLLSLHLGQIDPASFFSSSEPAHADPLKVIELTAIGLPVLRLSLSVNMPVDGRSQAHDFGPAFPNTEHFASTDLLGELGQNLRAPGTVNIDPELLGLDLGWLLDGLVGALGGIVELLSGFLTPIVEFLLATLGVEVGSADATVQYLQCGNGRLAI